MINRETVTISLPPNLAQKTKEAAKVAGMTQSEFFRAAVRHLFLEHAADVSAGKLRDRHKALLEFAKKMTSAEREALDILLDKTTYGQIIRSRSEERRGRLHRIESILE